MLNLYVPTVKKVVEGDRFTNGEKLSIAYHDLFDFPLTFAELLKWSVKEEFPIVTHQLPVSKGGYFFLEGREGLIYQRLLRRRISAKKLEIAKKASKILKLIPTVKMIGITGSLAMENSTDKSDIDLMIIAKNGSLWTTRMISLLILMILGIPIRRAGGQNEKDKLCLNIWLDEDDLAWNERNIYTAHEIAQVIPVVNKVDTYEKFLSRNEWILKFWPNSVRIRKLKVRKSDKRLNLFEKIAYKLQRLYMKKKMTREIVTPTRALFHPQDWGKVVLDRLNLHSVE